MYGLTVTIPCSRGGAVVLRATKPINLPLRGRRETPQHCTYPYPKHGEGVKRARAGGGGTPPSLARRSHKTANTSPSNSSQK